jgi:hypothetical protein
MTAIRTVESSARERHTSRVLLAWGIVLLVVAVVSGASSYLLDCNSPGFFVCGPMSLLAFQLRDGLAIAGIFAVSLSLGLHYRRRIGAEGPFPVRPAVSSEGVPPRRRDRLRTHAIAISVIIALALSSALAVIPVSQPFVIRGAAIYDLEPSCGGIDTQAGTLVSFQWNAPSNTTFIVLSCSTGWYTWESGTAGAGSFVSSGGLYEFGAGCPSGPCVPVNVEGRYVGPILPLV